MENSSATDLNVDKSFEKKEWVAPELIVLPNTIIKGSVSTGNDGGGVSTGS